MPKHAFATDTMNEEVKYAKVPRLQLDPPSGTHEEVKSSVPISQIYPPATTKEDVKVISVIILPIISPTSQLNPPTSQLNPPTSQINLPTLRRNIPTSELIPPTSELNPPRHIQLRESLCYEVLSKQPNFRRNNELPNLPPGKIPNPDMYTRYETQSCTSYSFSFPSTSTNITH